MDHHETPQFPDTLAPLTDRGPVQAVLVSFGYGHPEGVPDGDALIRDMRRFRNVPTDDTDRHALVSGTGLDARVRDYVLATPGVREYLEDTADALAREVEHAPRGEYVAGYLGCGGGRHRSVAGAEHVAAILRSRGLVCDIEHRDIDKDVLR